MKHIVLLCSILLGACSSVQLIPVDAPEAPVVVPSTVPMSLQPVPWRVLSRDDLKALAADPKPTPVFALDGDGYEAFARNLAEIKRFISEQKAVNEFLIDVLGDRVVKKPVPEPETEPDPEQKAAE